MTKIKAGHAQGDGQERLEKCDKKKYCAHHIMMLRGLDSDRGNWSKTGTQTKMGYYGYLLPD